MKRLVFFLTAATVTAISIAAMAHGGATGIVKERMDAMSAMSKAVKTISSMMMGETEYNADMVKQGAALIRSHAGEAMTKLFPEDSLQKASEAKPEIWSRWDEFKQLADQLSVQADGLELAAANGLMMKSDQADTGNMMGTETTTMMGSGNSTMMGGASMMGGGSANLDVAELAKMPADGVFNMLAQTCSSCHTKFRLEKK